MSTLDELRVAINQANDDLLKLLNQRAQIAQEIGAVKRQNNLPVYQPERELAVLSDMAMKNPGPLSDNQVKTIMQVVMQECRSVQLSEKMQCLIFYPCLCRCRRRVLWLILGHRGHLLMAQCCSILVQMFRLCQRRA